MAAIAYSTLPSCRCGHCKKLDPIWTKLGKHFASNDDVIIAKMDGTGNEVDGLNVRGFPTIKFYPKGAKTNAGEDYKVRMQARVHCLRLQPGVCCAWFGSLCAPLAVCLSDALYHAFCRVDASLMTLSSSWRSRLAQHLSTPSCNWVPA